MTAPGLSPRLVAVRDQAHATFSADVVRLANMAAVMIRDRGVEQARCDLLGLLLGEHPLRADLAAIAAFAVCALAAARAGTEAGPS